MQQFLFRSTILGLFLLTAILHLAEAQDGPPQYVRDAVSQVETMLDSEGNGALATFIQEGMEVVGEGDLEALREQLREIRDQMRGLRDEIAVEAEPYGVRMIFGAAGVEKQLKVALNAETGRISDLQVLDAPEPLNLTVDNLEETFDQLEAQGMAGVIYIKIDGEVVCQRAFGMANKELGIPNSLNTVFGTGSRPIDYTMASIYLLDQQGRISLEDKIGKFFDQVPEDKQAITIKHLLTRQSGLPDFFDTEEDWNPDLAWVDRQTAVRRMMGQELLFEPGTDRRHSHGAFGLLAAIVEIVSGQTYYSFINDNFFKPAGMEKTGEYGEAKELKINDFAVGGGPEIVGMPNIPPNWGPTSWLIKGSGGMYSTLGDLLRFYQYIRSGQVLDEAHGKAFKSPTVNVDGSMRGFELFSAYEPAGNEIYLFLNQFDRDQTRQLFRALEKLSMNN